MPLGLACSGVAQYAQCDQCLELTPATGALYNAGMLCTLALTLVGAGAASPAPEIFAPGIVSTPYDELGAALASDGASVYFTKRTPTTNTPPLAVICVARRGGGRWRTPEVAPFSGLYNDFGPSFTPDGTSLLFSSDRPVDGARAERAPRLWSVARLARGFGEPTPLGPVAAAGSVYAYGSMAANGTLYFGGIRPGGKGGWDLYRSRREGVTSLEPESLDALNTAGNETQPCVAPDESFLVFASSGREDALAAEGAPYPRSDLYVSFRDGDAWSAPRHLGPPLNTTATESNPTLSPDGRWLFFSSDRSAFTVPMPRPLTSSLFRRLVASVLDGWSNVYRVPLAAVLDAARRAR